MGQTSLTDRHLCRSTLQSKSWRKSLSKTIKLGFMGDNPCIPSRPLVISLCSLFFHFPPPPSFFSFISSYLVLFLYFHFYNFYIPCCVKKQNKKGRTAKAVHMNRFSGA